MFTVVIDGKYVVVEEVATGKHLWSVYIGKREISGMTVESDKLTIDFVEDEQKVYDLVHRTRIG